MHFNLVTIRLWSDLQHVPHYELRHLLVGSAYSDMSVAY